MTQDQFIKQEVYKMMRSNDEGVDAVRLAEIVENEVEINFNEDGNKLLVVGNGYNHVFGWSDVNGIYSLEN